MDQRYNYFVGVCKCAMILFRDGRVDKIIVKAYESNKFWIVNSTKSNFMICWIIKILFNDNYIIGIKILV